MGKNGRDLTSPDQPPPPAYRPATAPILPSTGGAWFGFPTTLLRKDTEFVEAHTKYLQARQQQLAAADNLVQARLALELTCTRLANIESIKLHEFARGQAERHRELAAWQHDKELATIQQATAIMQAETARLHAEIARIEAEAALGERQKLQPPPAPTPEPAQPPPPVQAGLTLDDIETVMTAGLPEVSESGKFAFLRMLRGFMAEKDKENQS